MHSVRRLIRRLARRGAAANRDAEKIREKATNLDKASSQRAELMVEWRQKVAPVLHIRRLLISRLGNHRIESDEDHDTIVQKLIGSIGPRYADRPGGYTRILKLAKRRLGDAGPQALIALVTDDGSPLRKRRSAEGATKPTADAKK